MLARHSSASFDRKMPNLLSIIEIIPLQKQAKSDILNSTNYDTYTIFPDDVKHFLRESLGK